MQTLRFVPMLVVALAVSPAPAGYCRAAVLPDSQADRVPPGGETRDLTGQRRPVDLVICLDTSGSMTALIDSARAKLWDVVNELALAKPTPALRVGLLTYGSPGLSTRERGWIVRQLDLTSDLDTVFAKMMAMSTTGGDEYVGWVLNDALSTMSWSDDPGALRLIFVAGNESADQASNAYNFRAVAEQARARGIVINAIYAGPAESGVAEHWDQVAIHGGGCYAAIDMTKGTIQLAAPQDKVLRELNQQLNATYLPYGPRGRDGAAKQREQDVNAFGMGRDSGSSRTVAKASPLYESAGWDLVDASNDPGFNLDDVEDKDLPEVMRPMNQAERRAYLDQMRAKRKAVQAEIRRADAERQAYLKAERAKRTHNQVSLDEAMRQAIRTQAEKRGFNFDDGPAEPGAAMGTSPLPRSAGPP